MSPLVFRFDRWRKLSKKGLRILHFGIEIFFYFNGWRVVKGPFFAPFCCLCIGFNCAQWRKSLFQKILNAIQKSVWEGICCPHVFSFGWKDVLFYLQRKRRIRSISQSLRIKDSNQVEQMQRTMCITVKKGESFLLYNIIRVLPSPSCRIPSAFAWPWPL